MKGVEVVKPLILLLILIFFLGVEPSESCAQESVEEIADAHFHHGFILLSPELGKKIPYGKISGFVPGEPVWTLAQWASKLPLQPGDAERMDNGSLRYSNEGKSILLGASNSEDAGLSLAIFGGEEYGHSARKNGEDWVHLLIQQELIRKPSLATLSEAKFRIEARLTKAKKIPTANYSPTLHAAQFLIYFSVQNLNRESPGFGKYLWFGIPIYDDRTKLIKGSFALDRGTNMYMYSLPWNLLSRKSAHSRQWIQIDLDLLPLMKEGLETAWKQGVLAESKSLEDYHIAGINMGWELPGTFDVEMQVRNLSLKTKSL